MHLTDLTIITPETSNTPSILVYGAIILGCIGVSVALISVLEMKLKDTKAYKPLACVAMIILFSTFPILAHGVITESNIKEEWNNEVSEIADNNYSPEELNTAQLMSAVHKQKVTTLTMETTKYGDIDVHVDGRAVTFAPVAPTTAITDIMKNLQEACITGEGPTTPQEEHVCTAYSTAPE